MEVFNYEQRSPEWYAARLGVITASSAGLVLYPARRKAYVHQLVSERLTGLRTPFMTNEYMEWGIKYEDEAREWYQNKTGTIVEQVGFCKLNQYVGCSPDGLIHPNGLLEIKCPMSKTHMATLEGNIKLEYKQQMQFQMWVTETDWCDFVSYDPRMPKESIGCIKRVFRDKKVIDKITISVKEMLEEIEGLIKKYEN
jgi:putative phage-type endonuclease